MNRDVRSARLGIILLLNEVIEYVDTMPDSLEQVTAKAFESVHYIEERGAELLELCLFCQLARITRRREVLFQDRQRYLARSLIYMSASRLYQAPVFE